MVWLSVIDFMLGLRLLHHSFALRELYVTGFEKSHLPRTIINL